mgnify:CR=1 FL=1
MKKYRVGLIGSGFIGSVHAEAVRRLGIGEVVALCEKADAKGKAEALYIPNYFEDYKKYNELKHVQVHQYLNRMDLAYASADIIISRAGAGSVSELCIVGKPVIFIPSPNVAEDHQTKNAMAVVDEKAAILIRESDLIVDFENKFTQLMALPEKQKELGENIKKLAFVNATKQIVDEVEKLLN